MGPQGLAHPSALGAQRRCGATSRGTTMTAELLTTAEAASLLRLNVKRVQALARAGELSAVRRGRRWLFRRAEVMGQLAPRKGTRPAHVRAHGVEARGINISARNQLRGR